MNCHRITPNENAWTHSDREGVSERELFSSDVVQLRESRLSKATTWACTAGCLYLVTTGELQFAHHRVSRGDLYWCNEQNNVVVTGSEGATFYRIEPQQGFGREQASCAILSGELPWENFDDPAGRPTQPVQVLLNGSLSVLRTRFDPAYIAGEHWHDFDTLYFISDGRMQFGDEGWFEQGEIRAVRGGHSYGPERPGDAGVEFVLVSVGGPVNLHWSDLEPPPSLGDYQNA